jgi:hypothetical protein
MARIIIYVRGGVVQGMLADRPGMEAMLVNYDDEEECPGSAEGRTFQRADYDPEYFGKTLAGNE